MRSELQYLVELEIKNINYFLQINFFFPNIIIRAMKKGRELYAQFILINSQSHS